MPRGGSIASKSKEPGLGQTDELFDLGYIESLCFNVNDDFKTLVGKNASLRELIIGLIGKVTSLVDMMEGLKVEHKREKAEVLDQLDSIASNYQKYAESHKRLQDSRPVENGISKEDYIHNFHLMMTYQKNLSSFIQDYLSMFHWVFEHITGARGKSSSSFIVDIKDSMLSHMAKYFDWIDEFNFPTVYPQLQHCVQARKFYSAGNRQPTPKPCNENGSDKKPSKVSSSRTKYDKKCERGDRRCVRQSRSKEPTVKAQHGGQGKMLQAIVLKDFESINVREIT